MFLFWCGGFKFISFSVLGLLCFLSVFRVFQFNFIRLLSILKEKVAYEITFLSVFIHHYQLLKKLVEYYEIQ